MSKILLGFVLVGVILLGIGLGVYVEKFVLVNIDSTPPIIRNPTPVNGGTYYSLSKVSVELVDLESGIMTNDSSHAPSFYDSPANVWYILTRVSGDGFDGIYEATFSKTTSGTYGFDFGVTNNAGLTTWYSSSGTPSYTIDNTLKGIWTINGVTITSSSQTVYFSTNVLNFQFKQTWGVGSGTTVTVNGVKGTTNQAVPMVQVASDTWNGTGTFANGLWNIALTAKMGNTTISFDLVNVQFSSVTQDFTYEECVIVAVIGIIVVVAGALKLYKRKQVNKW